MSFRSRKRAKVRGYARDRAGFVHHFVERGFDPSFARAFRKRFEMITSIRLFRPADALCGKLGICGGDFVEISEDLLNYFSRQPLAKTEGLDPASIETVEQLFTLVAKRSPGTMKKSCWNQRAGLSSAVHS